MSEGNPKGENQTPEVKTDAYYELRITELQKQLKTSNDTNTVLTKELERVRKGDADRLGDEISKMSTFTADELKGKSREELLIIRATLDKSAPVGRGIRPGNNDAEDDDSGLTVGRWDPKKKEWVK